MKLFGDSHNKKRINLTKKPNKEHKISRFIMAQGLNGKINFGIGDYNVISSALDMVTLEPNILCAPAF